MRGIVDKQPMKMPEIV